jgi:hypothetical protein
MFDDSSDYAARRGEGDTKYIGSSAGGKKPDRLLEEAYQVR